MSQENVEVLRTAYAQATARALGITRWHAVPADAPKVDWLWCHVVSFRDGLISQAQSFLDLDEALEAVGLRE